MLDNEVLRCIRQRRSARSFHDRQIEPEQLDALLAAATWAPSGSNSQSWHFTAIQNEEALARLNEAVRTAFADWTPDDDYPAKHAAKRAALQEDYHFFYHAPTLIVASNRPNYKNAMADCALALQNVFLAAHSLGLGSCYINQLHWLSGDPGVRFLLAEWGIPRENVVCSAAAIGYADKPSATPARKEGTVNIVR